MAEKEFDTRHDLWFEYQQNLEDDSFLASKLNFQETPSRQVFSPAETLKCGRIALRLTSGSSTLLPSLPVVGVKSSHPANVLRPGDMATIRHNYTSRLGSRVTIERQLVAAVLSDDARKYAETMARYMEMPVTATRLGIWAVDKAVDAETGQLVDQPGSVVVLRQETHDLPMISDFPRERSFKDSEMIPTTMSFADLLGQATVFDRSHMPT